MSVELALARIEAILDEIERLDVESGGLFRQSSDREARDITARILRQMISSEERNAPQKTKEHRVSIEPSHANA